MYGTRKYREQSWSRLARQRTVSRTALDTHAPAAEDNLLASFATSVPLDNGTDIVPVVEPVTVEPQLPSVVGPSDTVVANTVDPAGDPVETKTEMSATSVVV